MRFFSLLAIVAALSACGSTDPSGRAEGNAERNDASTANDAQTLTLAPGETLVIAGGSTGLQPGLWAVTHSRLGDPARQPTRALTQCLEGIDAAQPPAAFLAARKDGESCKFENLAGEGNQMFVTVRCEADPFFVIVAAGTLTSAGIDLVGGDTSDADTRITARRIGDC